MFNQFREDPDSDWSLNTILSPASSGRDNSVISYTDDEYPTGGYFGHYEESDMSLASERTSSEQIYDPEDTLPSLQPIKNPCKFIASDCEADFLSDSGTSNPSSTLRGQGVKRPNPQQQMYFLNSEAGP